MWRESKTSRHVCDGGSFVLFLRWPYVGLVWCVGFDVVGLGSGLRRTWMVGQLDDQQVSKSFGLKSLSKFYSSRMVLGF